MVGSEISSEDEREMRKGVIVRNLCRRGSVLAGMTAVIFARRSTKERGAEGIACLGQDYLMVCRYFMRISKYTLKTYLSPLTTRHSSLLYPKTNLDKNIYSSLRYIYCPYVCPLPHLTCLGNSWETNLILLLHFYS